MICTSKTQAERISVAGAAKMAAEGYTLQRSPLNPNVFRCCKADGSFYRVELGDRPRCSCAFFRANERFALCKHLVFCRAEVEAEAYCAAHRLPVSPIAQVTVATPAPRLSHRPSGAFAAAA